MGNGSADEQDRVRLEKAQAIGLFRFQLISPAIDDQLSTRARGVLVRQVAQGWHSDPFGNRVRYSRDTVDRWIRAWREVSSCRSCRRRRFRAASRSLRLMLAAASSGDTATHRNVP